MGRLNSYELIIETKLPSNSQGELHTFIKPRYDIINGEARGKRDLVTLHGIAFSHTFAPTTYFLKKKNSYLYNCCSTS